MEEQENPNRFELIYELLNEIENNQIAIVTIFQNHHTVTMKKLMKMQEHDEIVDMVNQIFERRISRIEEALCKIEGKLG